MVCFGALAATLLFSSRFAAAFTTVAYAQPSQSCMDGLHMIVARASDEEPGLGILEGVTSMVQKMIPNSDAVAVTYPATLDNYIFSEQEGVVGMKQLVTDYVQKCPNNKIALLGYSQGAQVVGDSVIGCDEEYFSDSDTNPTGLGTQYLDPIVALIMMGDPAFIVGEVGHVGNASVNGTFPRRNAAAFDQYHLSDKLQTYCDAGDEFCSGGRGDNALRIHLGYVNEYGSSAASYVASQFSAAGGAATGGSTASATSAGSSAGGSSSAEKTSATSAAKTSAAGASKASSSGKSSSTTSLPNNPMTSQRYMPFTGTVTSTFAQVGNLAPTAGPGENAGGVNTMEKGVAGAVFGAAMFLMGLL